MSFIMVWPERPLSKGGLSFSFMDCLWFCVLAWFFTSSAILAYLSMVRGYKKGYKVDLGIDLQANSNTPLNKFVVLRSILYQ